MDEKTGRAVIITSYLEHPLPLPALLQPEDFIVCLDGGYDIALEYGLQPDLLLGDFDSIRLPADTAGRAPLFADAGFEVRRYPSEKDYTDLELAFRVLDPRKTPDLLVIGGLGGRLDQTLVNIQLLQEYTACPSQWPQGCFPEEPDAPEDPGASGAPVASADPSGPDYGTFRRYRSITLMDGRSRCFVMSGPGEACIPREPESFLSLLPLSRECTGVELTGAKYPIHGGVLRRGTSLSISNEFTEDQAVLQLASGSLLVIVTRGNKRDFLSQD